MENDLYVSDLVESTRVTFDGSATVFNGVPDWVYEGERMKSHDDPKSWILICTLFRGGLWH